MYIISIQKMSAVWGECIQNNARKLMKDRGSQVPMVEEEMRGEGKGEGKGQRAIESSVTL